LSCDGHGSDQLENALTQEAVYIIFLFFLQHSFEEKEPISLNVHHMPICITFGFIENEKKGYEFEIPRLHIYIYVPFNKENQVCEISSPTFV